MMAGREMGWLCLVASDYAGPRNPDRGVRILGNSHREKLEVYKHR